MMAITLGSNIASLRGQRQLARTSAELRTVFERLSSGQRINRASDDAAGLSIADSLHARSRIFSQGVLNFTDGLSLINIADSAIEQLSSIVVRLQELAEQSANGVYTNAQRMALDSEAQALSDEYTRIIDTTEFNGLKLLNGETSEIRLQGGFGLESSLAVQIGGSGPKLVGTGSFGGATAFAVGDSPASIIAGDFNGDGILDIATGDYLANRVSILLGLGDGNFAPRVSYAVGGTRPRSIATGDLNGDGVFDIVTADRNSATLSVLLGQGDGTFAAGVSYATGVWPYSIRMGDFDGNGTLDLVTANRSSDNVSVLLGQGDGSFNPQVSYAAGNGAISVTIGDFNGDGDLDLATANSYASSLSVLLGQGDGSFGSATAYAVGSEPQYISNADLNGDGNLDLFTADRNSNAISVLLGQGDGTFGARVSYSVGSGPRSVIAHDFNGDSVLDLVTTDYASDAISVLIGRGDGTFDPAVSYAVGSGPHEVAIGDFDSDGVVDLAVADRNADTVSVLLAETVQSDGVAGIAPLDAFSLKSIIDSRQALTAFKETLSDLSTARGNLGGVQSRLTVAIATLEVGSENFRAAESRIRDADIADESSRLVRLNILQQAASSILAQANQQPALALRLLGA